MIEGCSTYRGRMKFTQHLITRLSREGTLGTPRRGLKLDIKWNLGSVRRYLLDSFGSGQCPTVGFLAMTEIADLTNNACNFVQKVHDSNLGLDTDYPA